MKKLLVLASFAITLAAQAYWTPVQVNLAGYLGLPPNASSVGPLRLNLIYGDAENVYGLDLGLFNHMTKEERGVRAGVINWSDGSFGGVTVGGCNLDDEQLGLSIGLINYANHLNGLQIGLLNFDIKSWLPVFPLINIGK